MAACTCKMSAQSVMSGGFPAQKCPILMHFKVASETKQKKIPLFNPPITRMKSSCIQGRFTEIMSCRGLDIFLNMSQKIEQGQRTHSDITCREKQQEHETQTNDFKAYSPSESNSMALNYNKVTRSQGH